MGARGAARSAALVILGVCSTGCAAAPEVLGKARGACTLRLTYLDPVAGSVPLSAPYVVPLGTRTPTGIRSARVTYEAAGWSNADITVETPEGAVSRAAISFMDPSSWGQSFDAPGVWTVRWRDEDEGCEQTLSVLVLP